jgi:hypothetical protein
MTHMPKLTLRDLFAVTAIVAVLVAWWCDHRRLKQENALYAKHKLLIESLEHVEWRSSVPADFK